MDIPKFYNGDRIKDPEERVVSAGLFLVRTLKKFPSQDQVFKSLDGLPNRPQTARATITKYWKRLHLAVAESIAQDSWLSDSVPPAVQDSIATMMNWARENAENRMLERMQEVSLYEDEILRK